MIMTEKRPFRGVSAFANNDGQNVVSVIKINVIGYFITSLVFPCVSLG